MKLPFGLDVKSVLFGFIFAYFILPLILRQVAGLRKPAATTK